MLFTQKICENNRSEKYEEGKKSGEGDGGGVWGCGGGAKNED